MPVDTSSFTTFQPTLRQAHLNFSLPAQELASFLASRLCHDLISPVGAINNAMELYEDGLGDEDTINLISMSADNASARLQFARLAYGAAGSTGDSISQSEIEKLANNYLADNKVHLHWSANIAHLPKEKAKFLLNMVSIAASCIPRNGDISIIVEEEDGKPRFLLHVEGSILRLPPAFIEIYQGQIQKEEISAHNIHFYWAILLSEQNHLSIQIAKHDDYIEFMIV